MITKISTKDREDWKALRHKHIGGSDAAAVVGLNPFCSPYSLWAEKTGKVPGFGGNLATEVGSFLEEFVAKKFEQETGKKVRRINQSILNDKYPFAIANIDRDVVGEDAGLEIKSTTELNSKRFKNGEFPENYYGQCVHYLGVTEKKRWYLAVLIGNSKFKIYLLTRIENDTRPEWCESMIFISDEEIASLMSAERKFWHYVETDTAPPTDGSGATTEAIKSVYPEGGDGAVNLFGFEHDLAQYMLLDAQIKNLQTLKDEYANRVKAFMGESSRGESAGYKVSWSSQVRSTFDSKRFGLEHPEIDLSAYYKTTSMRPFKITEKRG